MIREDSVTLLVGVESLGERLLVLVHDDLAAEVLLSVLLGAGDLGRLDSWLLGGGAGSLGVLDGEGALGLTSAVGLGVWVESEHDAEILERILLDWGILGLSSLGAEVGLDLGGVDDAAEVGVGDDRAGEDESLLEEGRLAEGAEDSVELLEGGLGPDDEATEMASRSELEEVEMVDADLLDSREIAEGAVEWSLLVIDDQRSTLLGVTSVSQLSLSGAELARALHLLDISVCLQSLEDLDGSGGLGDLGDGGISNDEWNLSDSLDAMSAGEDQRSGRGGSQSGDDGVTLLVEIDLSVPSAVDLGWGEHASTTAHVSVGSLSGSVGSSSRDTWDTGDGTSGSP